MTPNRSNNLLREVKNAEMHDIPGIIHVLNKNLISHNKTLPSHELEKTGFLIHAFTHEDAEAAIADKDNFIFLISTENDDVIGYALGCAVTKIKSLHKRKISVSQEIENIISSGKAFYLRHIAKAPGKNQVGTELLRALLNQTKNAGYHYIICQIAHNPLRNKASIAFHEKMGFTCVGTAKDDDNEFGIYLLNLTMENIPNANHIYTHYT